MNTQKLKQYHTSNHVKHKDKDFVSLLVYTTNKSFQLPRTSHFLQQTYDIPYYKLLKIKLFSDADYLGIDRKQSNFSEPILKRNV